MEEVRIGVFVCHCGINIGGVVSVPSVVEYALTLPDVVYAEENLFTCSDEGVSAIRKNIAEQNLTRVVVASCTPRTHEPLFRAACEDAGLNKYLFEMVNIRDQCSWVHMKQPVQATDKAKDLVRMGVARARNLQPLTEIEVPVERSAMVLGGGVAGMNAALNLAEQGFDIHLVEKERELGGLLRHLNKLFTTDGDAQTLLATLVKRVEDNDKIAIHLGTTAEHVSGFIGNFVVTLDSGGERQEIKIGTIIVAVGASELEPEGQYRYGELPNVITQLELEKRLKQGTFDAKNVLMINCVGARVPERTYCSRFCCMSAVKNATLIREAAADAKVWILHRDLMTYGVEFEDLYRRSMKSGVRYIRYDLEHPPLIMGEDGAVAVKVWHQLLRREVELPVDLVVLTTPLVPNEDNSHISKMLKVPLGEQGFFLEAHLKLRPVEFATDGIYICGSARWPTDVAEGISKAYAAAAKAAIPLRRGFVRPEAATAEVAELRCAGCGMCVEVCAYKALELVERDGKMVSQVSVALCKGCGTCGATCPSGAIGINHFQDVQLMAQMQALFG